MDATLATRLRWGISDTFVLTRRNLAHVRQIPEKLIDVTVQPLMFMFVAIALIAVLRLAARSSEAPQPS